MQCKCSAVHCRQHNAKQCNPLQCKARQCITIQLSSVGFSSLFSEYESFLTVSKKESACGACITSPSPSTGWGRGSGKEENPAPISTV
mmetsp:Transcript_60994/g.100973  ORF Transcript_60994/g.100973 Transcript_60994/m.100973 type:complete len:88 (+) Transcript_60994:385-648(+)